MTMELSRRSLLFAAGAGVAGLYIGFDATGRVAISAEGELVANPFVRIRPDGKVVVLIKHFEMGQGTTTGLTTLVAEELDANWDDMVPEFAPANAKVYANLFFKAQGTGGSTAIANSYQQYRTAGAVARDLMVQAAAKLWSVPASEVQVSEGIASHPSGKKAGFGELIETAAGLKPLSKPRLKSSDKFGLIGKEKLPRKDSAAKTDGSAQFAIDVSIPDMVVAVVARPPRFGGTVKSFDDKAARTVKGVVEVKAIPQGVVVYAKNTWAAIKGREALSVDWDESKAEKRSSAAILEEHRKSLESPGHVARKTGDVAAAHAGAAKTVSAEFVFPFLAHAPMEPLNCVIRFDGKQAEIWDGCQFPSTVQPTVGKILGIDPGKVQIHTLYAGGSFGRRASPAADYHAEAAFAVKAIDGKWPVKLVWTREDDIRGGYYRPFFVQRIEAGVDDNGAPVSWRHALAGKSILQGTFLAKKMLKDGVDATSVEGARGLPYAIPNMLVDVRNTETPVSVLWWRSVGHTHTAYSTEIAIDMLAEAAGKDPVEFRRGLLTKHPRHLGVLNLAAEKAGWGEALAKGRGRGFAVHESFNSFVAQVVDVSVRDGGAIKVERVVCAVDCGVAVNPDVIVAQMEGGIGYGLGAAMRNKITLADGVVEQSNFPDYEPLRISEMPKIEVHIVPSTAPPTGVGEPGLPPIAPALANAIHAATGKRVTTLPMTDAGIEFV